MLKKLNEISIGEVMTDDVITVEPSEDVVFAFEKLMKHRISALPVIEDDELVGIVTASDLGHNLILDNYELGTTVGEVMVKDVATVEPSETLADAIEKMNEYADDGIINQLVVVKDGKMVGIISDGDIIRALRDI